ncbi:Mitochondrial distribution and morphology protein 12 [Podila horticola]|nr:Mitochondrial distribution and morphology protein 12 [Podila horticola]
MSFVFEWDKLDDEVALQIEGMIHAHFQRIPKPSFMGNIAVSKFRFGATPPTITVLDVTDPLEEWYVHMDQEEARLAQEAAEAGGGESMDEDELASGEEDEDDYGEYSFSADGSIVMVGEGDDIEYLQSGPFEEDERRETEEWLSSRLRVLASPTRVSRSSSNASSSSTDSLHYKGEHGYESSHHDHRTIPGKRNNRNLKLDTSTLSASPRVFSSPADIASSAIGGISGDGRTSFSSHASDEEIESEAFYTQGESTIYQRMRNLVLEPSSLLSPRRSVDGGDSPNNAHDDLPSHQQQTFQSSLFSTTPSVTSPVGNSGGLGLGFGSSAGSGLGTGPGAVLSSVMQSRTNRPLSAASFYSTPVVNPPPSTTTGNTAPGPQLYFPDLSGMVVSGNSLLGLGRKPLGSSVYSPRAGTPSRTLPGTPRGFESPTLAFSRRQSFSEGTEPSQLNELHQSLSPTTLPDQRSHLAEMDRHHQNHNPSAFTSPVEALSFDAFSQSRPMDMQASTRADTNSLHTRTSDERLHGGGGRRGGGGEGGERRDERALADKQRRKKERHHLQQQHHQHKDHHHPHHKQHHKHHHKHHREATLPRPPVPSKRHENDIQLLLSVQYQGQMGFTVETELLLNYPTFAFLALPVKLVITGFSFKEPEDPNESILSNVRIESQVGDEQKQAVLKNVGKIERFVLEQMRKFITEDFVYPSYHSVKLERASATAPVPGSTPPSSSGGNVTPGTNSAPDISRHSSTPTTSSSILAGSTAAASIASHTSSSAEASVNAGAGYGQRAYSTSMRARSNTPSAYQRHQ